LLVLATLVQEQGPPGLALLQGFSGPIYYPKANAQGLRAAGDIRADGPSG